MPRRSAGARATITLRATFDGPRLTFAYQPAGAAHWIGLPAELDATILSDEYAATLVDGEPEGWGFTGAFVGLWVQDLGAEGGYADFDWASYRSLVTTSGASAAPRLPARTPGVRAVPRCPRPAASIDHPVVADLSARQDPQR